MVKYGLGAIILVLLTLLLFQHKDYKSKIEAASYKAEVVYKDKMNEKTQEVLIEYVDRWHTVKEKEIEYVQVVKNVVPSQFNLSNGWVYTHDSSIAGTPIDRARAADGTPSTITDNYALEIITQNNMSCIINSLRLEALQEIVRNHNDLTKHK